MLSDVNIGADLAPSLEGRKIFLQTKISE